MLIPATSPDDVITVIAEARDHAAALRRPGPEVDRRAATYLAKLTAGSAAQTD